MLLHGAEYVTVNTGAGWQAKTPNKCKKKDQGVHLPSVLCDELFFHTAEMSALVAKWP